MRLRFRTAIDCCKQFMKTIDRPKFIPSVGDYITIYEGIKLKIEMKVTSRHVEYPQISTTFASQEEITCWLDTPNGMDIITFEKVLKEHGFRW